MVFLTKTAQLTAVVLALAVAATRTVSAYTFDPLNNMWKPSSGHARPASSSAASAYYGARGTAEQQHQQYDHHHGPGPTTAWREPPTGDGAKDSKSLLQIEYNQQTGEVSLIDPNGIATEEDYKNLMQSLTGRGSRGSGVDEAVANTNCVGSTLDSLELVNSDDLEDDDVIDAVVEVLGNDDMVNLEASTSVGAATATMDVYQRHQQDHLYQQQHVAVQEVQDQYQAEQQQRTHYQKQTPQDSAPAQVPRYQTQPLYQLQLLQEQEEIMQATHDATLHQFQQQYQHQHQPQEYHLQHQQPTQTDSTATHKTPQSGGFGFSERRQIWLA